MRGNTYFHVMFGSISVLNIDCEELSFPSINIYECLLSGAKFSKC